jgi:HEPN domain-containing protein
MVDVDRQIAHWRDGAREDWAVARELVQSARVRHGLFFAHLAIEKALKAHVCSKTGDLPPRIHNLVRLAELAGVGVTPEHVDVLAEMNAFSMESRYPDPLAPRPTADQAGAYLARAEEVFQWLIDRF